MNVKVYRTVSGDTWDLIAFKVYGDEIYYHELIRANPNLIDIAVFDSDIPIIIPDLLIEDNIDYDKLPPWKRG